MDNEDLGVLAQRIDGVAWVLMSLIAQLEIDGRLNGADLCSSLRCTAAGRGRHLGLDGSAAVIQEIADRVDSARNARQSRMRPDRNQGR